MATAHRAPPTRRHQELFMVPTRVSARIGLAALLSVSLLACGDAHEAPAEATPPAVSPSYDRPVSAVPDALPLEARMDHLGRYQLDPNILPAHRTSTSFQTFKADEFDDLRLANPQFFAITAPPEDISVVRPMVEWEPMRAIVMAFNGYMLSSQNATATFVQIAKESREAGEVWFLVDGNQAENGLRNRLINAGVPSSDFGDKIKFLQTNFDSIWFIDSGPLPIVDESNQTFAFADFRYYHERPLDDAMPTILGRSMHGFDYERTTTTYRMPLTTEGGTFMATTDGICFTSNRQIFYMSCDAPGGCDEDIRVMPLSSVQNHPLAIEMRDVLAEYVGCVDLIVTNSVTDDGTGHLDMYLKVLDDSRVLVGEYTAPFANQHQSFNATRMNANADFIEAYVKPDGTGFTVERIPMPGHRSSNFGDVPFTYINSTFFNHLNLWPAYEHPPWTASRDAAEAIWNEVLPEMTHIWIDSTELSFYSGAIHCVTRTIPALEAGDWVEDGACAGDTCDAPVGGYDGVCDPSANGQSACWGPSWLCECNDCNGSCEPREDPCDGITYRGCCDGSTLYFCEQQELYFMPCPDSCGWSSGEGWYDCGHSGSDPSGTFPRACDGECVPDCSGKACGDDGCGGSCGTCDAGVCIDNQCRTDCFDCEPGHLGCDGDVAWLCMPGAGACRQQQRVDCAAMGRTCEAGDCVDREPDPEPDVVDGDTNGDDDVSPDTEPGPDDDTKEDGATQPPAFAPKNSSGCASSGAETMAWPAALMLLGLLLFRRRRSRGAV